MSGAARKAQAFFKGKIAPRQIKALHAIVGRLGMDDENYRHMLHSRYSVTSCKDLSWLQADELLTVLNGEPSPQPPPMKGGGGNRSLSPGGRGAGRGRELKYTDMDSRPGFASGAQCRLIDAMWSQVTRAEGEEEAEKALNSFCNRILGVAGLRMVKGWQVEKLVKALEGMGAVIKKSGGAA